MVSEELPAGFAVFTLKTQRRLFPESWRRHILCAVCCCSSAAGCGRSHTCCPVWLSFKTHLIPYYISLTPDCTTVTYSSDLLQERLQNILITFGFLGLQDPDGVRIFHEGLFWRCSFAALSSDYSVWDLWICKKCHFADLNHAIMLTNLANSQHNCLLPFSKSATINAVPGRLPLPVSCEWANEIKGGAKRPSHRTIRTPLCHWLVVFSPVHNHFSHDRMLRSFPRPHFPPPSVFRTFWSIFLVTGLTAVVTGGFVIICAGPLANHRLYKVGGVLQLCGGKDKSTVIFYKIITWQMKWSKKCSRSIKMHKMEWLKSNTSTSDLYWSTSVESFTVYFYDWPALAGAR